MANDETAETCVVGKDDDVLKLCESNEIRKAQMEDDDLEPIKNWPERSC